MCSIAYSTEFTDAMDYFRAVVAKQEISARALEVGTRLNFPRAPITSLQRHPPHGHLACAGQLGLACAGWLAWFVHWLVGVVWVVVL